MPFFSLKLLKPLCWWKQKNVFTQCATQKQLTENSPCDVSIVVTLNNSTLTTCSGKKKTFKITGSDTQWAKFTLIQDGTHSSLYLHVMRRFLFNHINSGLLFFKVLNTTTMCRTCGLIFISFGKWTDFQWGLQNSSQDNLMQHADNLFLLSKVSKKIQNPL